jgi:signal peptidase I
VIAAAEAAPADKSRAAEGDVMPDPFRNSQPIKQEEPPDEYISPGRYMLRVLREVLETMIPAVIIALLINLLLAQATRVYGQSMEPNLHTDQRLVVEKISYNRWWPMRGPQRGDVVVFRANPHADLLIKRVIGLPGDRVEIQGDQVFINGEPLNEPYLTQPTQGDYGPVDVPPLHIFVLGDNRGFSNDSRSFGPLPLESVVGRAWFSYWPPDQWGLVR